PRAERILGRTCYPSVSAIPEPVDLAAVAVPADALLEVVEDCGRAGVRAMVVISGGFREVGREGLQQEMVERAREQGIRIIGPNCIGVYNAATGFNTFFQREMEMPPPGNVAILTQSGTIGIGLLEQFAAGAGVSKFVSYGNRADVDELDLLRYLDGDPDTEVMVLYMESIGQGRKFFENLPGKPVVILKAGRTELGGRAALSHTGAMAANDAVFRGAARQYGALLADSCDELYDMARFLALQPLPEGGRVAMITNGAGPCVMAADAIQDSRFLTLSSVNEEGLREALPPQAICGNPVDLTGSATARHYLAGLQVLEDDPAVDIIMPFFVFQDAPLIDTLLQLYEGWADLHLTKPVVAVAMGSRYVDQQEAALLALDVPLVREPG
ncbi:MAG: acetate--CoA ligase family protein, partial [Thermoplasmatota archaeon]